MLTLHKKSCFHFAIWPVVLTSLFALSVLAQSSVPTDQQLAEVCAQIKKRSDDLDALLYTQAGLDGPLDPFRVNWTAVESFLAPGFEWHDNSLFPSQGNYTDYHEYWTLRIANDRQWPMPDPSVEQWNTCDPFHRREIAQWAETFGLASNASLRVMSTSIYLIEFDAALRVTRQAYWTSGDLLDLVPM